MGSVVISPAACFRTGLRGTQKKVEFRDGMHGLLVWALATLLGALIAIASAQSLARFVAPSTGSVGPSAAVAGENIIAFDLDRLFRSDRQPEGDINYARSEAARNLLTTSSHAGMQQDDRAYLVRLVASRAGIAPSEVEQRVNEMITRANEKSCAAQRSDPGIHDWSRDIGWRRYVLVRRRGWRGASGRAFEPASLAGLGKIPRLIGLDQPAAGVT